MNDSLQTIRIPDLSEVLFKLDDQITLRRVEEQEAPAVFEMVKANEKRLIEFMHWMTREYSLKMAEEFIERSRENAKKGEAMSLGIFQNEEFIGAIGFVGFDGLVKKTEIGYWIDGKAEGKGIISRATSALIEFAFTHLSMNRIEIRCSTANARSSAVPRRLGFTQEALLRESEMRNNELQDFYIFGLLRSEWDSRRNA